MKRCYASIDIGASTGRIVVGYVQNNKIEIKEIHRFNNVQINEGGHDCWNIELLKREIVAGLAKCKNKGFVPTSVGIDTWGVDFVLLDAHNKIIGSAVSYRDARTEKIYKHADSLMPFEKLYERAGIQRQPFNTIYQLLALKRENPEQLDQAKTFLMMPDYLHYFLTGQISNEYTNATTTGLIDARTCTWDASVLDSHGLPAHIFGPISMPGTHLGQLRAEIADEVGFQTEVILPATHDTASAFLAVPARDNKAVFVSSGTWSLIGTENLEAITSEAARFQNFTNEGGYRQRYRFLKNVMGLWMIQCIRRELNGVAYVEGKEVARASELLEDVVPNKQYSFADLCAAADDVREFDSYVNANEDRFLSPACMIAEIQAGCAQLDMPVPKTVGQLVRCVYISLMKCYESVIGDLSLLTNKLYTSINIVGGGCQDEYLNQMCANVCEMPVYAGPVEGTSLGNMAVQMIDAGEFETVQQFRCVLVPSFGVREYVPTIK